MNVYVLNIRYINIFKQYLYLISKLTKGRPSTGQAEGRMPKFTPHPPAPNGRLAVEPFTDIISWTPHRTQLDVLVSILKVRKMKVLRGS